ncbi:hypothetical protein ACODT3_43255, partial [Streptomyces sp. 4.24]|uniref:hypothetical protein n=1 Tax=Streptomyces tritrimontium TaxID=3406573 RepID=UPI003BB7DFEC
MQKQSTTTSYTGDSTASTAVQGGNATRTIVDALGRTAETRTYGGTTPNDPAFGGTAPGTSYTSVSNTYTVDGKQAAITGPDNAKWSYGYDLFGRAVTTTDPDKGKGTTTYTALDQIATSKDARNTVLEYSYDELGRKTGLWKSPKSDANKLAAWTYDTVRKGAPSASTRYEGGLTGKAYTKSVTAQRRPGPSRDLNWLTPARRRPARHLGRHRRHHRHDGDVSGPGRHPENRGWSGCRGPAG